MQFSNNTKSHIKHFVGYMGACKLNLSNTSQRTQRRLLSKLYINIKDAYNREINYNKVLVPVHNIHQLPKLPESVFMPNHIKKYIHQNTLYYLRYNSIIIGRKVEVNFYICSERDISKYDSYIKQMFTWLYMLNMYASSECAETLKVDIYMTPFKKKLPDNPLVVLDSDNINSAYTTVCTKNAEIVIFRAEEWFKVFIHETFHCFGLDFGTMDLCIINKKLKQLFPINSKFNLYEAYTEVWAEIINCVFVSFNSLKDKSDKETFLLYCEFGLQLERIFSLYQCDKVLKYMGITYKQLLETNQSDIYKENTNVFSYYVVVAILMNDYIGFINWCNKNNLAFFQFTKTLKNLNGFLELIKNNYKSKKLLEALDCVLQKRRMSKLIVTTTRMSLVELP